MSPIQSILILLMVLITVLYFHRLRSRFLDNAIVLALGIGGIVLILMPNWTTLLAHSLGVGRGADLIMYLGGLGIVFVCLLLYAKLRVLQTQLTELVRDEAVRQARHPEKHRSSL
jgi:hypothetical protein